jgi:hypothetical protein
VTCNYDELASGRTYVQSDPIGLDSGIVSIGCAIPGDTPGSSGDGASAAAVQLGDAASSDYFGISRDWIFFIGFVIGFSKVKSVDWIHCCSNWSDRGAVGFLESLGIVLVVIGALLGFVLKALSAGAWRQFIAEVPEHDEKFGRSVHSPLNSVNSYCYLYSFILAKGYQRYRIDHALMSRYARIRGAYIAQHALLLLGLFTACLGLAWDL